MVSASVEGSSQQYRPDIDGLRFIAVTSVLLSHAGFASFAGGFIGVDVFFVISGYLITGILVREITAGRYSILRFYERRARRILPALTVAMLAALAVGVLALGPSQFEGLAWSAIATTFFASNLWFWRTTSGYFGADVDLEPLLHTWSLGVEEQFYIIFPVALFLVFRFARRQVVGIVVAACALSLLGSALLVGWGEPMAAFYLLPSRGWELGLGALLALAPLPVPSRPWLRGGLAGVALAGIVVPIVTYSAATPFPGLAAVPPTLGTAMLIWLNGTGSNPVKALLVARPVVFVGLISYSLYLWHWPVIVYAKVFFGELTTPRALACILVSLVLATLSWRFVEQPFRHRGGWLSRPGRVFAASGAAMAATVVASLAVIVGQGFAGRLSPDAAAAFAATKDVDPRTVACRGADMIGSAECRLGARNDAPADFLLWGDSHAGAAIPAVDGAARQVGRSGYAVTDVACAPLLDAVRLDQVDGRACLAFNRKVIDFLRGRDDMPVVILDARWALPAEGAPISGENRRPALLAHTRIDLPSGAVGDNFAVFEAAFRETVSAIQMTGRTLVVFGSVPEVGWNVPSEVGLGRMHGRSVEGPDTKDVADRLARVDAFLRKLADEEGFLYVPVMAAFCDTECRVANDAGRPIYRDDDHLSRTGAKEYMEPLIASAMGQAFAASRAN